MSGKLLGIDLGTGGCKITIIDYDGNILAEATEEYRTHHPESGHSEQEPVDWFTSLITCLKGVPEKYGIDLGDIKAVSLDASTHNAVLMDENMDIIRPTIMWTDQRSTSEVAYLENKYGPRIYELTYHKVAPTWTLPQLLWIKNREPDNYSRIKKIMFVKDYIRSRLTGDWGTDYIDAQGALLLDVLNMQWSEELCRTIGLDIDVLPPLFNPSDVAGEITKEASKITGLRAGTTVIYGTSDSAIEDYGAGAIKQGQCILKLATAGNVNVMTESPKPNPLTLTYSHVIPGMWYTVSATNTAASAMRWFRDNFCFEEKTKAQEKGINVYEMIEESVSDIPTGSEGLLFHPYLLGERAPYWDPYLRSSFMGASMNHKRGHFLKSIMEGVGFQLKKNLWSVMLLSALQSLQEWV